MFCQWASKKLCKFFLKRLLGCVLVGDIDLDNLDVQLASGTIQLKDLSLNIHYFNEQLGDSSFMLKEGSVGRVTAKIPWKSLATEHCEVELDDLELLVTPRSLLHAGEGDVIGTNCPANIGGSDLEPFEEEPDKSGSIAAGGFSYFGIDDGVRMIARMVEKVLLGLRIKIRNLVILIGKAPDVILSPQGLQKGNHSGKASQSVLVLQIAHLEYGFDTSLAHRDSATDSLMEPAAVTKSVCFSGVSAKFTDVTLEDPQFEASQTCFSPYENSELLDDLITIFEGENGGASGAIELTIPWRGDSTNVSKVEITICLNPLNLRVSLNEVLHLISLIQSFKIRESSVMDVKSSWQSPSHSLNEHGSVKSTNLHRNFGALSVTSDMKSSDPSLSNTSFLPVSKFISDWMQWTSNDAPQDREITEADLAASVDEFFDCLDGTRSSFSTGSGVWNWTRSAFGAMTSASSPECESASQHPDVRRETNYTVDLKVERFSLIYVFKEKLQPRECHKKQGVKNISEESFELCAGKVTSFMQVEESKTRFNMTIKSIELQETVATKKSLRKTDQHHCVDAVPWTRFATEALMTSIDEFLAPISTSLKSVKVSECMAGGSPAFDNAKRLKGFNSENADEPVKGNTTIILLSISTLEDFTAGLKMRCDSCLSENCGSEGTKQNQVDISLTLQPFVTCIDMRTMKKMNLLILEFGALLSIHATNNSCSDHRSMTEVPSDAPPSHSSVNVGLYLPCVRLILSFPLDEAQECDCFCLRKDVLVLDIMSSATSSNNAQPLCVYTQSKKSQNGLTSFEADNLMLNIRDIEVCVVSEAEGKKCISKPNICCEKILQVSPCHQNSVAVTKVDHSKKSSKFEIRWHRNVEMSPWILKKAWDEVAAQRRKGDGGGGVGGSSSEFAAATASEPVEQWKYHVQEEILQTSSTRTLISLTDAKIMIPYSCNILLPELVGCLSKALLLNQAPATFNDKHANDVDLIRNPLPGVKSPVTQTSISFNCDTFEMIIHPRPFLEEVAGKGSKEEQGVWDTLRFNFQSLQMFFGFALGGTLGADYVKLHHEDCQVTAFSSTKPPLFKDRKDELLLLSCIRDNVGRGDGGGANALASGAAGFTLSAIVWPTKDMSSDTFITGTMKGGTLIVHGGRLDWLQSMTVYFTELNNCVLLHCMKPTTAGSSCSSLEMDMKERETAKSGGMSYQRTQLLFDLHDTAVCYVPGVEKSASKDQVFEVQANECGSTSFDSVDINGESALCPGFVACILAAAAIRVSSNVIRNNEGVQLNIKLRDVALHLLDTTLRNNQSFNYTPKAIQSAGYIQVAHEAVMEAFVRINCKESPDWEVEFVNNQLHFSTCQDTTAAFGRLITQLQQLFTPELQQSSVHLRNYDSTSAAEQRHSETAQRVSLTVSPQQSEDKGDNLEFGIFEGVLENAFSPIPSEGLTPGNEGVNHGATVDIYKSRVNQESTEADVPQGFKLTDCSACKASSLVRNFSSELPKGSGNFDRPIACDPLFIEDYYATEKQYLASPRRRTSEGQSSAHVFVSTKFQAQQNLEVNGGWYDNQTFELLDNHVLDSFGTMQRDLEGRAAVDHTVEGLKVFKPKKYPRALGRVLLRDLNARWKLYGGFDWSRGMPKSSASKRLRQGRQHDSCVEVILDGVDLQYDAFPAKGVYASKLLVAIHDVRIYDCSVNAPWRLVLGYYRSSLHPRETSSNAVKIKMESVRPNPESPLEEYRLSLSLLPIRLHLDQQHIDFFANFFSQDACSAGTQSQTSTDGTVLSGVTSTESETTDETLLPFFQICEIRPFMIRVDYVPRRLDLTALRGGNYAELLNLVSWKGIELQLKQVRSTGVHGWGSLSGVVFGEWLQDISQNQIHKFLKGLGPVRPFYALGSGAAKLITIPAKQYKKDRRLLRGMKEGAITFFRSISVEALGLGANLAAGAHQILLQTEFALGGLCSAESVALDTLEELQSQVSQPSDTREGLQQAYESINRGLERTASSLLGNPIKIYQRGAGAGLAVVSALKAAPAAALAPASAAAGAVHQALIGVRNGLDPEHKRESDEKHEGPPPEVKRCK